MTEAVYISALFGLYASVSLQGVLWPQLPFLITLILCMLCSSTVYLVLSVVVSLAGISRREVITTLGYSLLPMEWATAIIIMGDDALEFFNIGRSAAMILLGIGYIWSLILATSIVAGRIKDRRRLFAGLLPVLVVISLLVVFWAFQFLSAQGVD